MPNRLLAVCGVLEVILAAVNFSMRSLEGSLVLSTFSQKSAVSFLGGCALAAGVCAMAAGALRARSGKSWLLVLYGAALSAFGLLSMFWRGRLTFLPVALLFVVMALSIGILSFSSKKRGLRAAGVIGIGFAVLFLLMGIGWIRPHPPGTYFVLVSTYFAFNAIFMLAVGLLRTV